MTTRESDIDFITKMRKRPSGLPKYITSDWGGEIVKEMPVPESIDAYNHNMNGVDLADQMRTTHPFQRRCYRTWYPLWNYLRETTITNAYIIWRAESKTTIGITSTRSMHFHFCNDLAVALMACTRVEEIGSKRKREVSPPPAVISQATGQIGCQEVSLMPSKKLGYCDSCQIAHRHPKGIRKPLGELSVNSLRGNSNIKERQKRPHQTRFKCSTCLVFLCNTNLCIREHQGKLAS
jgi:hypothetical protein